MSNYKTFLTQSDAGQPVFFIIPKCNFNHLIKVSLIGYEDYKFFVGINTDISGLSPKQAKEIKRLCLRQTGEAFQTDAEVEDLALDPDEEGGD